MSGFHELGCGRRIVEVIDLRLNHVAVRVAVVDGSRGPVVDGPQRQDVLLLSLSVRQQEGGQRIESKGDMLQPTGRLLLWLSAWGADQCDAMVLLVIGNERDEVVLVDDLASEECRVVGNHLLQIVGSEHNVC